MKKVFFLYVIISFSLISSLLHAKDLISITSEDIILNEPDFSNFVKEKMPSLVTKLRSLSTERELLNINIDVVDFNAFWKAIKKYLLLKEELINDIKEYNQEAFRLREEIFKQRSFQSYNAIRLILDYKIIKKNIEYAKQSTDELDRNLKTLFTILPDKNIRAKVVEVNDLKTYVATMVNALNDLVTKKIKYNEFERICNNNFKKVGKLKNAQLLRDYFIETGSVVSGKNRGLRYIKKFFAWNIDLLAKVLNYELYVIENKKITVCRFVKILILVLVLYCLYKWLKPFLIDRYSKQNSTGQLLEILIKNGLYLFIFIIFLSGIGLDLTKITILASALSIGIGFGLQKIFANLVSSVILLLDKSLVPGNTIELGDIYGTITSMNARFTSVLTRDGKEYLIPNENLLTEKVINWTHSSPQIRLKIPVGISYETDVPWIMELLEGIATKVSRVLSDPKPACRLMGYGDSTVDLELRIWISDPENGIHNVMSNVLLEIWNLFKTHGIEFPFPQHDIHVKSLPEGIPKKD